MADSTSKSRTEGLHQRRVGILQSARRAFLARGYDAVNMDMVAAAAGVTKKTVYNHFPGKEALFEAVVVELCDQFAGDLEASSPSDDIEQTLLQFCRKIMLGTTPLRIDTYRLAIAHSKRFPKFGRALAQRAESSVEATLAAYLERQTALGKLNVDDSASAARYLLGAVTYPLHQALLGRRLKAGGQAAEDYLHGALRMFMRAYGVER